MQKATILLTGVTGFVGSTLAAIMLRKGHHIIALSRKDPDGQRTRAKIQESYEGFFPNDDRAALGRLLSEVDVLPYDYTALRAHDSHRAALARVDLVWHSAAEMSFSARKAVATFNGNVGMTSGLYQLIADLAPACRRFFYVSTAYTSGNGRELHREELHSAPEHVNPYQMSKWAAEMSLSQAQRRCGIPLTIFRPSVVVGHSENGFYNGQSFGIFAYAHLYDKLQQLGVREVHLDAPSDNTLDVVPIDHVATYAEALSDMALQQDQEPFMIVHATGTAMKSTELSTALERVYGVKSVLDSRPMSTIDHSLDQVLAIYKRFNNDNIRFDQSRMLALVPAALNFKKVDADLLAVFFANTRVPDVKLLKKLQPVVMSVDRMSKPFRKVKQLDAIHRSLGSRLKLVFF